MATYRFGGVNKAPKTRATQQCCEPACGPTTCGTSGEAQVKAGEKGMAKDQCCEPDCGPNTCP